MRQGKSRQQSIIDALVHCGPAMWQTSLAVALGLLVLVPADLLLISRFGWLMAAIVGVALLGDIILIPQLLAGPLGALLEPPKGSETAPATHHLQSLEVPPEDGETPDVPAPHFGGRNVPKSETPRSAS
jgi:hypothetical protein